jgi:dihydroorotate dehydrogenase
MLASRTRVWIRIFRCMRCARRASPRTREANEKSRYLRVFPDWGVVNSIGSADTGGAATNREVKTAAKLQAARRTRRDGTLALSAATDAD